MENDHESNDDGAHNGMIIGERIRRMRWRSTAITGDNGAAGGQRQGNRGFETLIKPKHRIRSQQIGPVWTESSRCGWFGRYCVKTPQPQKLCSCFELFIK
ncbi:hypothetical protein HPP92_020188 [Vanilla planifolia]|uniref:Uncharacterized protein n=1 Tax=Vanilla planifolia TaxID=51239 RepID=A0A835Q5H1_VANPL|nr:hypothetical protein HPP92_020188 [Vanilla planifolia]